MCRFFFALNGKINLALDTAVRVWYIIKWGYVGF